MHATLFQVVNVGINKGLDYVIVVVFALNFSSTCGGLGSDSCKSPYIYALQMNFSS